MMKSHKMPYGYPVNSGYEGWVVDRFMLFATERDYLEFVEWYKEEYEDD